ncbi:MAG: CRISPR-associated endonuclease Cas6, partial [Candidatus Hodarchaeales archaeon]
MQAQQTKKKMDIRILQLKLRTVDEVKGNSAKLRGYFATEYNHDILLHHHKIDKLIYRYPLVQYKILRKLPIIIALQEGVESITTLFNKIEKIRLGNFVYEILEKSISAKTFTIGEKDEYTKYKFITPWFALNQKNFKIYKGLNTEYERNELFSRVLTGNILSLLKSLGFFVRNR